MFRKLTISLLLLCLLAVPAVAEVTVVMETNHGPIKLVLDDQKAPVSVKNFLTYADSGFYEGTIFHRVIKDFMIQGGGFDASLKRKTTEPAIKNEADNGLKNERGTIAMARTRAVDSATSQFFINLKHNAFLDHKDKSARGYGYAVFGKVVEGMDVVDKIAFAPTKRHNPVMQDLPIETVVIKSVKRLPAE